MNPINNHPVQLKIWKDKSRFKVIVAGRRSGKTFLVKEKLCSRSEKPRSKNFYVAPTRQQAKSILWNDLKQRVFDLGWRCDVNESDLKITRANKSIIQLVSAEKPNRLRGLGIDFIAFDEYAEYRTDEIWREVVRPALSDKRGDAWFLGTPKGFNFLYELFNKAKVETNWSAFQFKTIDSPFFQTTEGLNEINEARKNLSERDFKQEYEASFENFAGRIYYAFNRDLCHSDLSFIGGVPIIVGADHNVSPYTVVLFQKHGSTLTAFSEIYLLNSNTEEIGRILKQRYPNEKIIIRPDATGSRRQTSSHRSDHQILREYGFEIQVNASNPNKIDRWASVNRSLEKGFVKINTKACPKLVRDLEVLCYKEGTCEPNLSDPMLGHISDAFGYAIVKEYPIIGKVKSYGYA